MEENITPVDHVRSRALDSVARFASKPENVFIVFWIIAAVVAAVFARPGTGFDEGFHIARSEQIAEGVFLPQEVNREECDETILTYSDTYKDRKFYGGQVDAAIYEMLVHARDFEVAFAASGSDASTLSCPGWTDSAFEMTNEVGSGSTVTWSYSNSSKNSPLCYFPYAVGFLFARLVTTSAWGTIAIMRIFGLLVFGALIYLAVRKCPFGKWILVALALSPNSVTANSMVTADAMTSAFTFLYLAVLLRFFVSDEPSRRDWCLLAVSLCGLALMKLPYICFGLMLFVAVGVNPSLRDRSSLIRFTAIGVGALVLLGVWTLLTKDVETYIIWGDLGIDTKLQSQYMLSHPIEAFAAIWRAIIYGDLGLFDVSGYSLYPVPSWATSALYLLAFLAECQKPVTVCRPKIVAASLLGVSALAILALGAALYLTFTAVGSLVVDGIQPRYYVPILFPVMLGLYLLFMGKSFVKDAGKHSICAAESESLSRYACPHVSILVICLLMLYLYYRVYRIWLPF